MRDDPDRPLTVGDLIEGLDIELEFEGWDYHARSNTLTVRLAYGGHKICERNVTIEPVGFQREEDDY